MKEKIAKIQKAMGTLQRDTPAYNYNYATLGQIQEKLNPLLEKHDLVLTQPLETDGEGRSYLATEIEDIKDGNMLRSSVCLPTDVKPQDMGSAITYYRRYSIVSLLNLQVEDDDGARASKPEANTKKDGGFEL